MKQNKKERTKISQKSHPKSILRWILFGLMFCVIVYISTSKNNNHDIRFCVLFHPILNFSKEFYFSPFFGVFFLKFPFFPDLLDDFFFSSFGCLEDGVERELPCSEDWEIMVIACSTSAASKDKSSSLPGKLSFSISWQTAVREVVNSGVEYLSIYLLHRYQMIK